MDDTLCYICHEELKERDLIIPVQINMRLPFGYLNVMVMQHYMCGLNNYFENINSRAEIAEKDRLAIEAKLMEVLTNMRKGTTQ
jgi:hypothetical protein